MQIPGTLPIFGATIPAVQQFGMPQASAWGGPQTAPAASQNLMFMLTSILQAAGQLSGGWSSFAGGAGMAASFGAPNQAAAFGALAGFGFAGGGNGFGGAGMQLGGALFGGGAFGGMTQGYGAAPNYGFAQGYGFGQSFGHGAPQGYGAPQQSYGGVPQGQGFHAYGGVQAYAGAQGPGQQASAQYGGYTQPPHGSNQGAYLHGNVSLQVGYDPGEERKMWDVWFDTTDGRETRQLSPIVLDLNNNGKADITGKNILGDGKLDGPLVLFDMDPDNVAYELKSQQRRPGSGAPAAKGGHWVDANGQPAKKNPPSGVQKDFAGYRYLDGDGKLVGEMKDDGLYHYGKQEHRELTEWLAPDGGDGMLVWDYDGDGNIESAKELFGTVGLNGETFDNGFEKLAHYFDKDGDGQVTGAELEGLQIWVDKNADGIVDEGELQSLAEHGITSFDVSTYNGDTMEGSYRVGGGEPTFSLSGELGFGYFGQQYPAQPPYQFPPAPHFGGYGGPVVAGGYAVGGYGWGWG